MLEGLMSCISYFLLELHLCRGVIADSLGIYKSEYPGRVIVRPLSS